MENAYYPFVNLPLPYPYNGLEPYIDEKTMMLHHDRHLQTYIDNLNVLLQNLPWLQKRSLPELIQTASQLPEELQTALRNNAGGVYNHRFYFDLLAKPGVAAPSGTLLTAIDRDFGSFSRFQEIFKKAALSVFGSGYAWLVEADGRLRIVTSPNQNTPLEHGLCPILAVDVWEHAYYLKHYNLRGDYVDDWFRVVNWPRAQRNFAACLEASGQSV
ncbi:MAG: superoxide dismutase [Faecousia sp.]